MSLFQDSNHPRILSCLCCKFAYCQIETVVYPEGSKYQMEDDDQEKMVGETEESAPLVAKKRIVSSDDLIEELVRNRSWKYTALVMSLMIVWLGGPTTVYLTSFAGY